jgi:hypothetical protein
MTTRLIARESIPQSILSIDLTENRIVYEISVPTCSYRMGVNKIGYGVLLLDSGKRRSSLLAISDTVSLLLHLATKTAHLAILGTPRRYLSLYLYATYGIFFVISLILTALFPRRSLMKSLRP